MYYKNIKYKRIIMDIVFILQWQFLQNILKYLLIEINY
jgi:hypothetical protein